MRFFTVFLCLLLALAGSRPALATTWDEPWHEQVVKGADCLVLAKVKASDPKKGLTVTIIRTLAGPALSGTIHINGFYLLHLCSTSAGEGPEFHLGKVDTCYFFLKKSAKGYSMATPTTGFAAVVDKQVVATYRHSYHQAMVAQSLYEPTMKAIFSKYHGQQYNTAFINAFIEKTLALPPAKLDEAGMATFFRQHVALETMYHLGLTARPAQVLPFLSDTTNFHARVSAARALTATNTPETHQLLLALLSDKHSGDFLKVVAITTLQAYHPTELKPALEVLAKTASEEENGFGGNIMDPRVCTQVPTVKAALTKLVAGL